MKTKLLRKLRSRGRSQINITSITEQGTRIIEMTYGYNDSKYKGLFDFGDTEESVLKKAERIYIQEYLNKKS